MTNSELAGKQNQIAELQAGIETALSRSLSWIDDKDSPEKNYARVKKFSEVTVRIRQFHALCLEINHPKHREAINNFRELAVENDHKYAVPIIDLLLAGPKPARRLGIAQTIAEAPYLSVPDAQPL